MFHYFSSIEKDRERIIKKLNLKVIEKRDIIYQEKLKQTDNINHSILKKLPLEYQYTYNKEGIYAGFPIYKKRNEWIVLWMFGISMFGIFFSFFEKSISLIEGLKTLFLLFFLADIQTGVLHLILDNRKSFQYPILSQPCLEFLWHHILPYDLADRYCIDIFGDLNTIMVLEVSILEIMNYFYYKKPIFHLMISFQILFIYFAIYCHRISHSIRNYKGRIPNLIFSHHKKHHEGLHNKNYCLIGIADFLITPFSEYSEKILGEDFSYFFYIITMLGLLVIHPLFLKFI